MKKIFSLLQIAAVIVLTSGCYGQKGDNDSPFSAKDSLKRETMFQVSTLQAIMQGDYNGSVEVEKLLQFGDIGLGTYDGLDGEMVVLDGKAYQCLANSTVREASSQTTTPFATVTFFDSDITDHVANISSVQQLSDCLTKTISDKGYKTNHLFAAKIEGTFSKIRLRSEQAQHTPYKPLEETMKTAAVFTDLTNVNGTIVAIYRPDYLSGVCTPGWHFHFISANKKNGGHVVSLQASDLQADIDCTRGFMTQLPDDQMFGTLNLKENPDKVYKLIEIPQSKVDF